MDVVLLYTLGPLIILVYKILEYFKFWNYVSRRSYAISGLERLKSPSGFPRSWIYNEDDDKKEFKALFKRIKKNTKNNNIKIILKEGKKASLLSTAGSPIPFKGVPPEWAQENRAFYSPNHSVLMIFGVTKKGKSKGKAERCCTLAELEKWIDAEKKSWDFWLGVVVMTMFSIASIVWRLQVLGKI